jgi:predicted phosphodiesterase
MPTIQKDLVLQTLSEFPKAGSRTIADVLVQRHPRVFKNIDSARDRVRHYRGNKGKRSRREQAGSALLRPNGAPGKSFPDLPEGITSFDGWGALEIDGPVKALILSDVHVPYHDRAAVELAVEQGKGVGLVILNGDTMDCFELSKYQPDPRKCDFIGALGKGRAFIEWLRRKFPKARVIFKEGNHEERLERYFATRAPAVLGVEEFELRSLLKLDQFDVEWLGEKRPIRLGKLNVIHGHEHRMVFSNPVNPARGLFLRAKTHALAGHWHQFSQHSERDIEGKVISTWSTGCLSDLHPAFSVLNNWSHGAATVEVSKDGHFHVENFKIIDGRVY